MAKPTTAKGGKMLVKLGDGGSPEIFAAPCGFNSKTFTRSKTLNEVQVPDCDDPDAPQVVERDVQSIDWEVSGEGILAAEALATWDAFNDSTDTKNVQIVLDLPAPTGTITYTGAAHLESFEIVGQIGQRITVSITLKGSGELVRSPALS